MSGRENKREKREKFVRNSKDSCLKRVEENARERVLTAAPSGRRSSLLFPFRAYDTQRYIATPIATTHACIYIPFITWRESGRKERSAFRRAKEHFRIPPSRWANVRPPIVLSNFLFHFFPNSMQDRSRLITRVHPLSRGGDVVASRFARRNEQQPKSRGIYITRGYWRAFLSPTEYRYHERCSR